MKTSNSALGVVLFLVFCLLAFGPGRTLLGIAAFIVMAFVAGGAWWLLCKIVGIDPNKNEKEY